MTDNDDVCMVLPLYQGARFLAAALESALAQTRPLAELVVVDDGSTDEGPEVVAGFPSVRLLRHPENLGVAAARNTGVAATAAPLVAFLDQDDLWHPEKTARQAAFMAAHPELAWTLAHTDLHLVHGRRPRWLREGWLETDRGYNPSGLMIRRQALAQVGGFDPSFRKGGDDVDLFFKLKAEGLAGQFVEGARYTWRIHDANTSEKVKDDKQDLLAAARKQLARRRAAARAQAEAGPSSSAATCPSKTSGE